MNAPGLYMSLLMVITAVTSSVRGGFPDWLVQRVNMPARVTKTGHGTLRLTNGLITREFCLEPGFATVDYYSHEKQSSLLRAVGPEAIVSLDGVAYKVGGFLTDIPRAYMNRSALAEDMREDPAAFKYSSYDVKTPVAPFPYTPKRGAPKDVVWPPAGVRLDVLFKPPAAAHTKAHHQQVSVTVHYEMYDAIPLLVKWLTVTAGSSVGDLIEVGAPSVEYLALNQQWSPVSGYNWLYIQTDQAHGTAVNWGTDPAASQMPGSFQPVVNCSFASPPSIPLGYGFESFRVQELVVGSSDRERIGLARRKMVRLLAPHTQENPIFFHNVRSHSPDMRKVVDQMAEVGFEMMIYSFGSGFDLESTNETYLSQIAADIAYAHRKGIEVGGYDLIALTRTTKPEWMAVNDQPSKSSCFASGWYDSLLKQALMFMDKTGLSMLETDGPYGGYPCSSTNHSHHRGEHDSVYMQEKLQGDFFRALRERTVYINQPDNFFYQGGSKTGMGYNENQYSLPRWQDLSVSRQGFFDDTFHYTPTIGWMFLPLVDYHGGGAAAAFEPLTEHKVAYEWGLAQYLGAGIAACYRGYRLYDSAETKAVVTKWVSFYKKYRDIVTSDIIHVRRADMQGVDCYLHANPFLPVNRGLAMVFNPTLERQTINLTLPLYYTGLTSVAKVSQEAQAPRAYNLERDYSIEVPIDLSPLQITWFLIQ